MPYASLLVFAAVFAFALTTWSLPPLVAGIYLVLSAACFVLYARDKSAAREGRRRTPERTLLLLGLVGGWPGAVLAQQWLRHKSSKRAFLIRFWATVALNFGAFAYLASALR